MKKLILLILLVSCSATRILVSFDEPIVKTYKVDVSQDDLFINANRWMISIFRDARSVIQFSDKDAGILIGKYLLHHFDSFLNYFAEIYAIIEINVKDGKGLISIKPDNWDYLKANYSSDLYDKEKALSDINALCEDFNKNLQSVNINF